MKETYRTRSLMPAAWLLLQGAQILDIIPSEAADRSVILFDNTEDAVWRLVCRYYDENPAVRIHDLARARATVFDLIRAKRGQEVVA